MTIRKILVPLIGAECDEAAIKTGFVTTKRLSAHMEALFIRPDPKETLPYFGEGLSGAVIQDILAAAKEASDKSSSRAREWVSAEAEAHGVQLGDRPGRPGAPSATFREVTGPLAETVTRNSRLCDLILFVHGEAAQAAGVSRALHDSLVSSGKPILLGPETPAASIGTRVAIGWDGSVEAAEAVRDAMPFLQLAREIHIICIKANTLDTDEADQLALYLELHGLTSTEHVIRTEGRPIGEVLLDHAAATKADLLVMGGYGHSRIRELLLGGVTRHVLSHATVPVLLAHS